MSFYIEEYWDPENEDLKPGWKSLVFFDVVKIGIRAKAVYNDGSYSIAVGDTKEVAISNLRSKIRYHLSESPDY